jgi:glycosyltransferase involved in cell wall biosynthesis
MIQGRDIVCISSLDWDAHWGSVHQVIHRFSSSNRVLYVDEPVTMLTPLVVSARWKRWKAVIPNLRQADANMWVLASPPLLPFRNKHSGVNRVNQAILARYVRWAMKKLAFAEDHILWTYLPATAALLDSLYPAGSGKAPALVLYHCVDEHSAFPGYLMSAELVRSFDDELTRRSDLVITTSENLRKSRQVINPNTHTVLNAADIGLFNKALEPDRLVPADLAKIPTPRLGVVGVHDYRLDVEAIAALVRADPTWHVALIGPMRLDSNDAAKLRRLKNVHILGGKPREKLPSYLKGLNVALIPYRVCELTRNIFPLKLFEYLAAGLPVVAGGLPELERYADVVALAENVEDYAILVRAALAAETPQKRAARVALAAENSWENRVAEISALVESALAAKPQYP